MKYYLAHNFEARQTLMETIKILRDAGHKCTSTWLITDFVTFDLLTIEQQAQADLKDIDEADMLILFVDKFDNKPGRGKWVELGYALGRNKMITLIGTDFSCIFTSLDKILRVQTIEEFLKVRWT